MSFILAVAIGRELHSKQVLEFPLSHLEHAVVTTFIGILSWSRSRLLLPLDDVLLVLVRGQRSAARTLVAITGGNFDSLAIHADSWGRRRTDATIAWMWRA